MTCPDCNQMIMGDGCGCPIGVPGEPRRDDRAWIDTGRGRYKWRCRALDQAYVASTGEPAAVQCDAEAPLALYILTTEVPLCVAHAEAHWSSGEAVALAEWVCCDPCGLPLADHKTWGSRACIEALQERLRAAPDAAGEREGVCVCGHTSRAHLTKPNYCTRCMTCWHYRPDPAPPAPGGEAERVIEKAREWKRAEEWLDRVCERDDEEFNAACRARDWAIDALHDAVDALDARPAAPGGEAERVIGAATAVVGMWLNDERSFAMGRRANQHVELIAAVRAYYADARPAVPEPSPGEERPALGKRPAGSSWRPVPETTLRSDDIDERGRLKKTPDERYDT